MTTAPCACTLRAVTLAMHALAAAETTQLDTQVVALLVGTIIPILVGIVTKLNASPGTKAVINALLSAIAGALSVVLTNEGALVWREFVFTIGITWLTSVATYYGLWKPAGVTGKVATSTRNFGLGGRAELAA